MALFRFAQLQAVPDRRESIFIATNESRVQPLFRNSDIKMMFFENSKNYSADLLHIIRLIKLRYDEGKKKQIQAIVRIIREAFPVHITRVGIEINKERITELDRLWDYYLVLILCDRVKEIPDFVIDGLRALQCVKFSRGELLLDFDLTITEENFSNIHVMLSHNTFKHISQKENLNKETADVVKRIVLEADQKRLQLLDIEEKSKAVVIQEIGSDSVEVAKTKDLQEKISPKKSRSMTSILSKLSPKKLKKQPAKDSQAAPHEPVEDQKALNSDSDQLTTALRDEANQSIKEAVAIIRKNPALAVLLQAEQFKNNLLSSEDEDRQYIATLTRNMPEVDRPLTIDELADLILPDDNNGIINMGEGVFYSLEEKTEAYVYGDIAHIENVLPGERKEFSTVNITKKSNRTLNLTEEEIETSTNTESSSRFELDKVTNNVLQDQKKGNINFGISGGAFGITVEAGFDLAPHNETTDDNEQKAMKFAQETIEQVREKMLENQALSIESIKLFETSETLRHTMIAPEGSPISGIYRWVNERKSATLFSEEPIKMLEFMIPRPGESFHTTVAQQNQAGGILPEPPHALKHTQLTATNYLGWLRKYDVPVDSVSPPPEDKIYLPFDMVAPRHIENNPEGDTNYFVASDATFRVPTAGPYVGYEIETISGTITAGGVGDRQFSIAGFQFDRFRQIALEETQELFSELETLINLESLAENDPVRLEMRRALFEMAGMASMERERDYFVFTANPSASTMYVSFPADYTKVSKMQRFFNDPIANDVRPVECCFSVSGHLKYAHINATVLCVPSSTTKEQWQLQVYETIVDGYHQKLAAYQHAIFSAGDSPLPGISIPGRNPLMNKEIIEKELKKQALWFITNYFKRIRAEHKMTIIENHDFSVNKNESDSEFDMEKTKKLGKTALFFEQSLLWHKMIYLFYPYYWLDEGQQQPLLELEDPDIEFQDFLQASYVRVVIPIRESHYKMLALFLQTGVIWGDGIVPEFGTPENISLFESYRERHQRSDNDGRTQVYDRPFFFELPTAMVILQEQDGLTQANQLNGQVIQLVP